MKVLILGVVALFLASVAEAAVVKRNEDFGEVRLGTTLSFKEPIDPGRKYFLGWEVNNSTNEIIFEVEVATTGYVGFGISPNGGMTGADLFIAGVYANKTNYSGDYHGTRNGPPTLDNQQDWTLLEAEENSTHTRLRFSRLLDTCDKEGDFPITMDTARVIWSFGLIDDLIYHEERGTVSMNFLLPDLPFNPEEFQYFDTMVNMTMPEGDTTYWCTIHKGPQLSGKHHVVAFDANLNSPEAIAHTHHVILFSCTAPEGEDPDEFFGQYLNHPGNNCYDPAEWQNIPSAYCQQQMVAWAKGGRQIVFPEEVGYPIGENPGVNQYYMFEIHYDNPDELKGVTFETGLRTYYTPELREYEAGLLILGHDTTPSLLVPPQTSDYIVAAHCAPECLSPIPPEGIKVFNSLLHGHLSARKIKTRQFRNGEELPWFDNDEAYDFNFQQNKAMTQYKTLLPGDQLTIECTYDSTWHENRQAIPGGFASRDEMCQNIMFYYPVIQGVDLCQSGFPLEEALGDLGFTKFHDDVVNGFPTVYIDEPEQAKGPFIQSASFKVNWTEEFKREFQEKRRFGVHTYSCGRTEGTRTIAYPEVREEYQPGDQCSR